MKHHIRTLLVITCHLPWSIFDHVITYLSLELVFRLCSLNQTSWHLPVLHNDISFHDLAWDCSSSCLTYIWFSYNIFFHCPWNWFLDYHSWTKPVRIVLSGPCFGLLINFLNLFLTWLYIVTYFLSLELVSGFSSLNQTS